MQNQKGSSVPSEIPIIDKIKFSSRHNIQQLPDDPNIKLIKQRYKCQLSNAIGRGSFSRVYLGTDILTDLNVAIKRIEMSSIPEQLKKQIISEIQIVTSLDHPHIVKTYDVAFETNGQEEIVFIIMEYCSGGDFDKFLKKESTRMKESKLKHYMFHLMKGLQYLRNNQVIHRDLKPANLLLSDDNRTLKIADFGFARRLDRDQLTATSCGSPIYMAPEILFNQPYNDKSDLWSVGIIVYQSLYGAMPFTASSHYELIDVLKKGNIVYPRNVQISAEGLDLLSRLLRKDYRDRMSWDEFFSHPWWRSQTSIPSLPSFIQRETEIDELEKEFQLIAKSSSAMAQCTTQSISDKMIRQPPDRGLQNHNPQNLVGPSDPSLPQRPQHRRALLSNNDAPQRTCGFRRIPFPSKLPEVSVSADQHVDGKIRQSDINSLKKIESIMSCSLPQLTPSKLLSAPMISSSLVIDSTNEIINPLKTPDDRRVSDDSSPGIDDIPQAIENKDTLEPLVPSVPLETPAPSETLCHMVPSIPSVLPVPLIPSVLPVLPVPKSSSSLLRNESRIESEISSAVSASILPSTHSGQISFSNNSLTNNQIPSSQMSSSSNISSPRYNQNSDLIFHHIPPSPSRTPRRQSMSQESARADMTMIRQNQIVPSSISSDPINIKNSSYSHQHVSLSYNDCQPSLENKNSPVTKSEPFSSPSMMVPTLTVSEGNPIFIRTSGYVGSMYGHRQEQEIPPDEGKSGTNFLSMLGSTLQIFSVFKK